MNSRPLVNVRRRRYLPAAIGKSPNKALPTRNQRLQSLPLRFNSCEKMPRPPPYRLPRFRPGHAMTRKSLRSSAPRLFSALFSLIIFFIGLPLLAADGDKTPPPPAGPTAGADAPAATGLVGIYSLSSTIPEDMLNLQERLSALPDASAFNRELAAIADDMKKMQEEIAFVKNSDRMRPAHTQVYDGQTQLLTARLKAIIEPVRKAVLDLSSKRELWLKHRASLSEIQVESGKQLGIVDDEKKNLSTAIERAITLIDKALSPYLDLGRRAGDMQAQLQAIQNDLRKTTGKMRAERLGKREPLMWDADFYTRFNLELLKITGHSVKSFIIEQTGLAREQGIRLLWLLPVIPLAFLIRWSRRFRQTVGWVPFANRPLTTAIFLTSSAILILDKTWPDLTLPQEWKLILRIANILAMTLFLLATNLRPIRRRALIWLAIFFAAALFLIIFNLPIVLIFLYVLLVSLLAIWLYCHRMMRGKQDGDGKIEEIFRKSWGILPAFSLIASLSGFEYFAVFFFFVVMTSIVSVLMVWMLFRFHIGLLEFVLSLIPLAAIHDHQAIILRKCRPILLWAHGLLMLALLAVVWTIYPSVDVAITGVNNFGFDIGDIHLSLRFFAAVILIFYVGLLISQTSQYMLVQGILPRYISEMGVRLSIARLTHYVIISITFLVMLRVLGFKLQQLTIVGGALSVGIGFGLQAIVNNFASGLILLFERPIKVGDTIRLGSDTGEVKEVGLRATIIRTYDNAEIVVPNSMLITGQVTNWTLANRRARMRVPISVAYGSDVAKVMEILLACAMEHPGVLSAPKPTVLFLAFAASSLDFELRVWLPDYLDSTNVLSELNIEIESRFDEAGIEMPFPQSDLHLRSLDQAVVEQLRRLQGTGDRCQGAGNREQETEGGVGATVPGRP